MKESTNARSRDSILSRLRAGQAVGQWEDLSVYPSDDLYVVEFYLDDPSVDLDGLTPDQARQLTEDGELFEHFDTPEEAADLFLKLQDKYGDLLAPVEKPAARKTSSAPPPEAPPAPHAPSRPFLELTESSFDPEILQAPVPALVFFWTKWSGPDRIMLPLVMQMGRKYDSVQFGSLDVEEHPAVTERFQLTSVPACILFKGGREVNRLMGPQQEAAVRAALDALLA